MTSGERMVWAAEFVRALGDDLHCSVAARQACVAVRAVRDERTRWLSRAGDEPGFSDDARAMLDDMLAGGR